MRTEQIPRRLFHSSERRERERRGRDRQRQTDRQTDRDRYRERLILKLRSVTLITKSVIGF